MSFSQEAVRGIRELMNSREALKRTKAFPLVEERQLSY
jgi:hypothetical protein